MDQPCLEGTGIPDPDPGPQVSLWITKDMHPTSHFEVQATHLDARQGLQEEALGEGGWGVGGFVGPGWVNTGTRLIHSQKASQ